MDESARLLSVNEAGKPSRPSVTKSVVLAAVGFVGVLGALVAFHANPTTTFSSMFFNRNPCLDNRFFTLNQLTQCVHTIPYNASEKAIILEHIRRAIPSYVFTETAKREHSFGPYTLPPVDLDAELNAIEATDFDTDLDLHNAIYSVFRKLNDAHTSYHKPSLYSSYYALLPVSLISVERGDSQVVQMAHPDATEVNIYKTFFSNEDHDFDVVGWDVTAIDGQPALDVLRNFADTSVGTLKDGGTRFNLAVSGFATGRGFFIFRPLSEYELPTSPSVEFTLVNPRTQETKVVSYNWIALNGAVTPGRVPETNKEKKLEILFQRLLRQFIAHGLFEPSPEVSYVDSGDDVGVLKISGFSPSTDQNDAEFNAQFAFNVTLALAQFTEANKKTLIIDLTENGGGDICLGYATIRYLFPQLDRNGPHEAVGPHTSASYHLRHSALFDLLATQGGKYLRTLPVACKSEFCPSQWYSPKTHRQFLTEEWMTQPSTSESPIGAVSQPVYFGCGSFYDNFPAPGSNFKGLDRENVILVSHGYCGSTCSVFSSYIQMHNLAQTVAFGGYANTPQQFFSFPGGQVYNTGAIYSDATTLNVSTHDLVPQPLSDISDFYANSGLNFAMLAISPWDDKSETALPLEYKFVPATHSPLFAHSPYNATAMYTRAVQLVRGKSN
ncbi:hypothetical protein LEN26_001422 [Aphanomyces euteiches]|nr:hypothetical protein AeMF1_016973 [Aphanomyces euteiches]KAH9161409.1 hypothetical protein LEN26_001422 [Aphanomyces euteiches]